MQKYIDAVEHNLAAIDSLARDYTKHVIGADTQKLLAEWAAERERLVGKGIKPALISSLSFVIPLLPQRWVAGGMGNSSLVGANGGGYSQGWMVF